MALPAMSSSSPSDYPQQNYFAMRCLILPRLRPCSQNSSLSLTTAVIRLLIWRRGEEGKIDFALEISGEEWQNWWRRSTPYGERRKTAQGTVEIQVLATTAFHLNQREYE
ncbi:hypothetical protein G5I_08994 [Acromyrmex echinatior]|uniref:Uncharacterized protein n=1 Tax=Acromyrmex echinatior TaxID=103372 RepID=F4WT20_ACREC|nr:hypothetical protein G5I_08994 [Acromyrmex echinatior]